jgi:polynucleotide 5'-kinase involved in rRNA processing
MSGGGNTKSYGAPTIALLNPQLFKEMAKEDKGMKDPIAGSLKNIKERHTYQEHRQQRIDKRNHEITRELKQREEEKVR